MRFKVKRVGNFGDSKTDFVVRLSKCDRDHLGLQDRALVKVKKGDKKVIAIVRKQFMDLASYPEACSVNKLLTNKLSLEINDEIEITADVTQEEADKYISQEEFDKRQVTGAVLSKEEKKKAKDIMESMGLFADEPGERQ